MKHRNCHLAMHLVGNRGAGVHSSNYATLRHEPAPEFGELADDELREHVLSEIAAREAKGATRHYSTNFLGFARNSDINYCLDSLVEQGILLVSREYRCSSCGAATVTKSRINAMQSDCCAAPRYRMTSEFFSS
jgi:hypothetical protein